MLHFIYLFLAGILGGFIAGFLGGGGGIVYIVVLQFALKAIPGISADELATYTVANSIFGIMITTFFGNLTHLKLKTFYLREVLMVGIPGALVSIFIVKFFVNTSHYTPDIFHGMIILLLIFAIINGTMKRYLQDDDREEFYTPIQLNISGLSAGVISALSGLGGGIVLIPLLKFWLKMGIKKAKSISLGMIFISTFAMSAFNLIEAKRITNEYTIGLVVFPVLAPILIGVLFSAPYGVHLSHRVSSITINRVFIGLMIVVLLKEVSDFVLILQ